MSQRSVESRWWLLVAGVLVWAGLSTILLLTAVVFQLGGGTLALLAYGAIGVLILPPVGLYMDGKEVGAAETGWQPDVTLYVVGSIVGVFFPLLSIFVAGVYLNRRRAFVGVP